jgi:photosystem II stability/assembly factor-like uncharacterized protein
VNRTPRSLLSYLLGAALLAATGCTGNGQPQPQPPTSTASPPASDGPAEAPPDAAFDFVAVDFVDARRGWIAGADEDNNVGAVFRTADGGATWTKVAEFASDALKDIDFLDATHGWAVGDTAIYRTSDGGQTWFADPEHVFWSIRREVAPVEVKGTSPGTTMTTGEIVTSMFFIDATTGWAVADVPADPKDPSRRRGTVYATTDGGSTWTDTATSAATAMPALTDVWFVTAREGWVAGGNVEENEVDVVLHTVDGGKSWTRQATGVPQMVRAVHFADASRGWAVGLTIDLDSKVLGSSRIVATADGGASWTQQFASPRSFHDVYFADPLHGWAVGDRSAIYATGDGGKSWAQQSRFVTGSATAITAPGRTRAASGQPRSYTTLCFVDALAGCVGGDGVILKRK